MNELIEKLQPVSNRPDLRALFDAVIAAKTGDQAAQLEICGALIWAAYAAPGAITPVYDALADGWLHGKVHSTPVVADEAPLPESFWQAFGAAIAGSEQGYDASSITATVAALGGSLRESFGQLAEAAARARLGDGAAAQREAQPLLSLDELGACPDGSLARDLHHMWLSNGFDAEVLDREAIGLNQLSPALRYLNTRILQMHDVWHLVAGYETTALHEIAISAFQLAQFGHNYSAMFLAAIATIASSTRKEKSPEGFGLLMHVTSEAWQHGRATPAMMEVEWEQRWHLPTTQVRDELGISPFIGVFPADLFEQLNPA